MGDFSLTLEKIVSGILGGIPVSEATEPIVEVIESISDRFAPSPTPLPRGERARERVFVDVTSASDGKDWYEDGSVLQAGFLAVLKGLFSRGVREPASAEPEVSPVERIISTERGAEVNIRNLRRSFTIVVGRNDTLDGGLEMKTDSNKVILNFSGRDDPTISSRHAVIGVEPAGKGQIRVTVLDGESTNGTMMGGVELHGDSATRVMNDKDQLPIQVGNTTIQIGLSEPSEVPHEKINEIPPLFNHRKVTDLKGFQQIVLEKFSKEGFGVSCNKDGNMFSVTISSQSEKGSVIIKMPEDIYETRAKTILEHVLKSAKKVFGEGVELTAEFHKEGTFNERLEGLVGGRRFGTIVKDNGLVYLGPANGHLSNKTLEMHGSPSEGIVNVLRPENFKQSKIPILVVIPLDGRRNWWYSLANSLARANSSLGATRGISYDQSERFKDIFGISSPFLVDPTKSHPFWTEARRERLLISNFFRAARLGNETEMKSAWEKLAKAFGIKNIFYHNLLDESMRAKVIKELRLQLPEDVAVQVVRSTVIYREARQKPDRIDDIRREKR